VYTKRYRPFDVYKTFYFLTILVTITFNSQLQMKNVCPLSIILHFKTFLIIYWWPNLNHIYYLHFFPNIWNSYRTITPKMLLTLEKIKLTSCKSFKNTFLKVWLKPKTFSQPIFILILQSLITSPRVKSQQ
jgi:hypothetical protein